MESIGLTSADFDCGIDVVRSIMGVEIAFIVKETERGFKASLRSVGANVAEIAAKHGGGGHIRASGCNVEAKSVDEAAEILLADLAEHI
jgi:phosphoesterase RecJ-like protein